jgi:DNA-binding transcriptional ArsR family regulator
LYAIYRLIWALEVSILLRVLDEPGIRYSSFYKYSGSRGAVNRAVRSLRHQGLVYRDEEGGYRCTGLGEKTAEILGELRRTLKDMRPVRT